MATSSKSAKMALFLESSSSEPLAPAKVTVCLPPGIKKFPGEASWLASNLPSAVSIRVPIVSFPSLVGVSRIAAGRARVERVMRASDSAEVMMSMMSEKVSR